MSDVSITRWRRYGKDRLYVTDTDGGKLGWHDVITGKSEVTDDSRSDDVHAAVARWRTEHPAEMPAPVSPPAEPRPLTLPAAPAPTPPAVDIAAPITLEPPQPAAWAPAPVDVIRPTAEWTDLATHRAGQMAREQALALKAAAPVRTLLARALRVHTDERAWRIGADGEEKVAARLAKLVKKDPRWRCLHSIPVGENGSDIDHLLIGPAGVYTLNAKHHPNADIWVGGNTLMVNGQRQPYIRNSRHEASRAGKLLTAACRFPVDAAGLIVFIGVDRVTIKSPPGDIHLLTRTQLTPWLRAHPALLGDEAIATIFDAARRSTTWRTGRTITETSERQEPSPGR